MKSFWMISLTLIFQINLLAQNSEENTLPNNAVQEYATKMTNFSTLKHSGFSFYAKDMSSGAVVAQINPEMSMPTASTMKLVTTATASMVLGRGYRFTTRIQYSGELDSITGILDGDIYIKGGGDPTLGSKYYNRDGEERDFLNEWADSLYSLGIRKVTGRVIADASIYTYISTPTDWVYGDMGNTYGAGPSGLTIFDNTLQLHYSTGSEEGEPAVLECIDPYIPGYTIKSVVRADKSSKDNTYAYGAPLSNDWFVGGSIPVDQEDYVVRITLPDPEYVAALEFDYALEQAGIKVAFAPTTNRFLNYNKEFNKPELTTLIAHHSPYLGGIIDLTNKHSINLFAEHILCQISVKLSGYGSTSNGAQKCMNYWSNKIDGTGLFMTDGSGLARSNAISAKFLVDMLTYMHGTSAGSGFRGSMAVAGKSGTMSGMCRGTSAYGRVYGKSGTMTRVKSYAGYVYSKSDKKIAYAMIINNPNCSTSKVKSYFENLMVKMSVY